MTIKSWGLLICILWSIAMMLSSYYTELAKGILVGLIFLIGIAMISHRKEE